MKKRFLSIFLVLAMMLSLIPGMSLTASAEGSAPAGKDYGEADCILHDNEGHFYSLGKLTPSGFVDGYHYITGDAMRSPMDLSGFVDGNYEEGWYYSEFDGPVTPCYGHGNVPEVAFDDVKDAIAGTYDYYGFRYLCVSKDGVIRARDSYGVSSYTINSVSGNDEIAIIKATESEYGEESALAFIIGSDGVAEKVIVDKWSKFTRMAPVSYVYYEDGEMKNGICTNYEPIVDQFATFEDGGWYVIQSAGGKSDGASIRQITVNGTANLILGDNTDFTVSYGIRVPEGSTLNIYGQSEGSGVLTVYSNDKAAGIGGGNGCGCGTVNIHGGNITTRGDYGGAGIGGGLYGNGGAVTIYGGNVTARSILSGSGIGGGDGSTDNGTLTLGKGVTFCAGNDKDNISVAGDNSDASEAFGKNYFSSPSTVKNMVSYVYYTTDGNTAVKHDGICQGFETVTDTTTAFEDGKWYAVSGNVTVSERIAVSGTANLILKNGAELATAAGIGVSAGGTLNIYQALPDPGKPVGKLIATGSSESAGIICFYDHGTNNCGTVNIHGGDITASGSKGAAGIGGNAALAEADCGIINIYGGSVTATGAVSNYRDSGAGIGGGKAGIGGTVNIYGGTVTAYGGPGAAGIGAGSYGYGEYVTINGGTVAAYGGDFNSVSGGAGIGGGCADGSSDNYGGGSGIVTINGGTVTAVGGAFAAGIGAGMGRINDAPYDDIIVNNVKKLIAEGGRALGSAQGQLQNAAGIHISSKLTVKGGMNESDAANIAEVNNEQYVVIVFDGTRPIIVGEGETLDLKGETLTVEKALTVNNGGKIINGTLRIKDGAVVSLGENGGWVPVPVNAADGYKSYELHKLAVKLGKDITDLGTGAKFALGYKYAEHLPYIKTAAAAVRYPGTLKLGAFVSWAGNGNELSGDIIISKDGVSKMTEVKSWDPEAFYRVNLSIRGAGIETITAQPMVSVKELGFRMLADKSSTWEKK